MILNFLYKIWSGYNGFTPDQIPERMVEGDLLELGWRKYLDVVDKGAEVWIYFHGAHPFTNGVYVRGFVQSINLNSDEVVLRVQEYRTDEPLTDDATGARVAAAVAARGQQVFVLPDDLEPTPDCDLYGPAASCAARECAHCVTWKRLPAIDSRDIAPPERLDLHKIASFAAGWWVIPSRCYIPTSKLRPEIQRTSRIFYRFKAGEKELAYPLALAAHQALSVEAGSVDAVVPIPLSPDKAEAGEINRTRLLASEIGGLLGRPVSKLLSLDRSISKRRLGLSAAGFESRYRKAISAMPRTRRVGSVLVVDDVATRGSTLKVAAEALHRVNPELCVHVVCAGQMIVKPVVRSVVRLRSR